MVDLVDGVWTRVDGCEVDPKIKNSEFYRIIKLVTGKIFVPSDYEVYDYNETKGRSEQCICSQLINKRLFITSKDNKYKFQVGCVCINRITDVYKEDTKFLVKKFEGKVCEFCNRVKTKIRKEDRYECKDCPCVLHFGKHKGKTLAEIPDGYKKWMIREGIKLPLDPSP